MSQRLLAHFLRDGSLGDDGNAGVNLDGALDGLDVVELHRVLHLDGVLLENAVQGFTGGDIRLEADKLLAGDGLELDAFVFCQGVLGMADQDQRLLPERKDLQLAIASRIRDQAQINDIAEHILVNLVGAAVFDVDVDGGVGLEELLEVGRQIVQADAVDGGDPDGAGNDVLDLLQLAVEGVVSGDDLLAVVVKNLAFAGEAELLFAALNKERLEEALERTDLLAHRRLGHFIDLGSLGKALSFRQVAIDFKTLNLHKPIEYGI